MYIDLVSHNLKNKNDYYYLLIGFDASSAAIFNEYKN